MFVLFIILIWKMLKSLSRDPRTFSEMTILKGVLYDHQKVFFREKKLHKHLAEGKNLNIHSVIILILKWRNQRDDRWEEVSSVSEVSSHTFLHFHFFIFYSTFTFFLLNPFTFPVISQGEHIRCSPFHFHFHFLQIDSFIFDFYF